MMFVSQLLQRLAQETVGRNAAPELERQSMTALLRGAEIMEFWPKDPNRAGN